MAAPMLSNFTGSKNQVNLVVLGNSIIVIVLFSLTFIPFNNKSQLDIVSNPFLSVKILTLVILCLHVILHVTVNQNKREQKFRLNYFLKDAAKVVGIFVGVTVVFHLIAVLLGAPLLSKGAETFHFAMILAAASCGTALIHLGLNTDSYIKIFIFHVMDSSIDVMVFTSVTCSIACAWLGAFPIPLDWDRPWQTWPTTCVLGTVIGHCVGMILSTIYLLNEKRKNTKQKHV